MARKPDAGAIYEIAQSFSERCIRLGKYCFVTDVQGIDSRDMHKLWAVYMDNPDYSGQSFYEKWQKQLTNESKDVHRIAADLVALYYLFPHEITKGKKLERLNTVISWKLGSEQPNLASLDRAYDTWIGNSGPAYMNRVPEQIRKFSRLC